MKIGILTFHLGNNYGGILQCYALQQILIAMGHSVEIINYRNTNHRSFFRKLYAKISTATSLCGLFLSLSETVTQRKSLQEDKAQNDASIKVFDKFRERYLNISESVDATTIGEYSNSHYDLIITGSDQVWTSLFDTPLVYMADWNPRFNGKRMSYAACSAYSKLRGRQKDVVKECLKNYDIITVRDRTTQKLVTNILGNMPQIVPDPSLLYHYDEFKTKNECKPYILTYILGDEIKGGHSLALQKIKQQIGNYPIYSIVIPCNNQDINIYADKVFKKLSPEEWVDMFYHALYVYTDSFHAIMFSLKFQKPFTAYYKSQVRSSRLRDLKACGIHSIYEDAESISSCAEIYNEEIIKNGFKLETLMKNFSKE